MSLLVINSGTYSTIQDEGRIGYREWGVPVGGAFDRRSAALANALLGNAPDCAVLELTLVGGVYEAKIALGFALAGAPMAAALQRSAPGSHTRESQNLALPMSGSLEPGDRLVLGGSAQGVRTYLAVRGGWKTPVILGSRSRETRLQAGDLLPADPSRAPVRRLAETLWSDPSSQPLRIVAGPDAERGPPFSVWEGLTFRVGPHCDRIGLRLEGPTIAVEPDPERLSTPVAPGAVQVAGGQPIVLGVACGTMGGYPHLAHVIAPDLDRLAQLRPGDSVRFQPITLAEARRIDRATRGERAERVRRIALASAPGA